MQMPKNAALQVALEKKIRGCQSSSAWLRLVSRLPELIRLATSRYDDVPKEFADPRGKPGKRLLGPLSRLGLCLYVTISALRKKRGCVCTCVCTSTHTALSASFPGAAFIRVFVQTQLPVFRVWELCLYASFDHHASCGWWWWWRKATSPRAAPLPFPRHNAVNHPDAESSQLSSRYHCATRPLHVHF